MKDKYPTFWANTEKIPNTTPTKYSYIKGDVPATRFVLLFNLRTDTRRISFSKSLYDSKAECFAECDELDKLYAYHPLPIKIKNEVKNEYTGKSTFMKYYDYSGGKSWWGYIVLDFEQCKIIRVGGTGFYVTPYISIAKDKGTHVIDKISIGNKMEVRDYFFRDVDKVPDDYSFDDGEYEGWLQFKWGDGKNAIDYVPPKKNKPKPIEEIGYDIETEGLDIPFDNYQVDLIEKKFADLLDKETVNKLHARYW